MLEPACLDWRYLAPLSLTGLRLLLAPLLLWLAYRWPSGPAFIACLVTGLLSDVLDGVVARRLGVATPLVRRMDSGTDVVFYLAVLWAAAVVHPEVIWAYTPGFGVLLGLEVVCQSVSFGRSGRPPATHAYSAKCWGLFLFAAFAMLLGWGVSSGVMDAMIVVGCVANVEVIAIMLVAPPPAVDVPSLWHAWRRGRHGRAFGVGYRANAEPDDMLSTGDS